MSILNVTKNKMAYAIIPCIYLCKFREKWSEGANRI
jgi:hypothetical protein